MNKDVLKAKGVFSLLVIEARTGVVLSSFEENNLVVTMGHGNVARLLGGNVSGAAVTKIGLGTNGTAPTLADTALSGLFSKAIIDAVYPEPNSVRFNWAIDASEANGMVIKEFGLLTTANTLVARKVRTEIVKTSDVRLVGSWKITFNS